MTYRMRKLPALALIAVTLALTPLAGLAQNNSQKASETAGRDRWLHIRVDNPDSKDCLLYTSIPTVLPAIAEHDLVPWLHPGARADDRIRQFDPVPGHQVVAFPAAQLKMAVIP